MTDHPQHAAAGEPAHLLAIATYEKGQRFLEQAAAMGVLVHLLTVDELRDADWPRPPNPRAAYDAQGSHAGADS